MTNVTEWLNAGVECMGVGTLLTKGSQAEIAKNAARLRKGNRHICELTKRGERVMIDQRTLQLIQKMIQNH